jgi:hypothetical protein
MPAATSAPTARPCVFAVPAGTAAMAASYVRLVLRRPAREQAEQDGVGGRRDGGFLRRPGGAGRGRDGVGPVGAGDGDDGVVDRDVQVARSTAVLGTLSSGVPVAWAGWLMVVVAMSFHCDTAFGPTTVMATGATAGSSLPPHPKSAPAAQTATARVDAMR